MKFVLGALKAFYAAAIAVLTGLVALLVNNTSLGDITAGQWVTLVLAGLVAFGGTYGLTNKIT
jgi:hypothetical protein